MKTAIIHIPDSEFEKFTRFAHLCEVSGDLHPKADYRHLLFMAVLVSANTGDELTIKETGDVKTKTD